MAAVRDCWNREGVWAGAARSCPRLAEVIHCRNCRVFTEAGRRALERRPPKGYRREQAAHLARPPAAPQGGVSLVVFALEDQWFGLPTLLVDAVLAARPVHRLPHNRRPQLLGVVNVDGRLRPCVALHRVLGLALEDRGPWPRFLVLGRGGTQVVLPVQGTGQVCRLAPEAAEEPPATLSREARALVRGVFQWGGRAVAWLDGERLSAALEL